MGIRFYAAYMRCRLSILLRGNYMKTQIKMLIAASAMLLVGSVSAQMVTTVVPSTYHPSINVTATPGAASGSQMLIIQTPGPACGAGTPNSVMLPQSDGMYESVLGALVAMVGQNKTLTIKSFVNGSTCYLAAIKFE